jgi:hypothetical protein
MNLRSASLELSKGYQVNFECMETAFVSGVEYTLG